MLRVLSSWLSRLGLSKKRAEPEHCVRDHSPDEDLPTSSGELWVGIRQSADDAADRRVIDSLTRHVETSEIGEWTGQSSGSGQLDVTFDVVSQSRARQAIKLFLTRRFPARDFWVSSDYQTKFDVL